MSFNTNFLIHKKRKYINIESRRMFNDLLHTPKGQNFKKNVPLSELIDSKIKDENEKFKMYVGLMDDIVEYSKVLFNVDLSNSNITIQSTAQEVIDTLEKIYMSGNSC